RKDLADLLRQAEQADRPPAATPRGTAKPRATPPPRRPDVRATATVAEAESAFTALKEKVWAAAGSSKSRKGHGPQHPRVGAGEEDIRFAKQLLAEVVELGKSVENEGQRVRLKAVARDLGDLIWECTGESLPWTVLPFAGPRTPAAPPPAPPGRTP